jgi:hypothetical protein
MVLSFFEHQNSIKNFLCTLNVCEILGIDKEISSTFVAFLEVSVGTVREIPRIA